MDAEVSHAEITKDLVRHLVEKKGIDVNIKSGHKTSLHLAIESGNLDLVKRLVEKRSSY